MKSTLLQLSAFLGFAAAASNIGFGGSAAFQPYFDSINLLYSVATAGLNPKTVSFIPKSSSQDSIASVTTTFEFDFAVVIPPISASQLSSGAFLESPLVVSGLAFVTKIPGFQGNLNLTLATVERIFSGQITSWSDPEILASNPAFPGFNNSIILLAPNDQDLLNLLDVALKRIIPASSGLSSSHVALAAPVSSSSFAIDWAIGVAGYGTLLPLLPGQSICAISYQSSHFVLPSADLFTATLPDFPYQNYSMDTLFLSSNSVEYPLTFFGYLIMLNAVPTQEKCDRISDMIALVQWSHRTSVITANLATKGYSTLPPTFLHRLWDQWEALSCPLGTRPYYSPLMFGGGGQAILSSLQIWKAAWSETADGQLHAFFLDYVSLGTGIGQAGYLDGSYDFVLVEQPLQPAQLEIARQQVPDRTPIVEPIVSEAIGMAYNLPELSGGSLVLDREMMVGIYTTAITHWNDPVIVARNPALASVNQPITLIIRSENAGSTYTILDFVYKSATPAPITPEEALLLNMTAFLTAPGRNATYVAAPGLSGVAEAVRVTNYSLAYLLWDSSAAYLSFVRYADMWQPGVTGETPATVQPGFASIGAAVSELLDPTRLTLGVNGARGATAYPICSTTFLIIPLTNYYKFCEGVSALIDFFSYTLLTQLSSPSAVQLGPRFSAAGLELLSQTTCCSQLATSCVQLLDIGPCLFQGVICSDHGFCNAVGRNCSCDDSWTGDLCELEVVVISEDTSPLSAGAIAGIAIAFGLTVAAIILVIGLFIWRHRRRAAETWLIEWDALDLSGKLGEGAFGEVWRAEWRGEEVAVKTISAQDPSKEQILNFRKEVSVMVHLRHPNIILFMGAVIQHPHYGIVMELMPLGALYDILHNENLPGLPYHLKLRLLLQSARGMNFLHTNDPPILHRDFKSLNILIDAKWTAKISDFGLTVFTDDLGDAAEGTLLWTAPEVLEDPSSFTAASDVYSFGIIMWEVITQDELFYGLSPTAVAIGVLREDLRPVIPAAVPNSLTSLIQDCWDAEPTNRPNFRYIVKQLSRLVESEGPTPAEEDAEADSDDNELEPLAEADLVPAPIGSVCIVLTDVWHGGEIWNFDSVTMKDAVILHNSIIQKSATQRGGYRSKTDGESFMFAFSNVSSAVAFAVDVNHALMKAEWPPNLMLHPAAAEEWDEAENTVFRGLRLRVSINWGLADSFLDPLTRIRDYFGAPVNKAASILAVAEAGQIMLTAAAKAEVTREGEMKGLWKESGKLVKIAQYSFADDTEFVYEIQINGLNRTSFREHTKNPTEKYPLLAPPPKGQGESMARWVINYAQLSLQRTLGQGTYGVVYRATWRGVEVAVKRFLRRHLKGDSMLDFKSEVGIHSQLEHPNIVSFVGACIKPPNLCIVTEYCRNGSLRSLLDKKGVSLTWEAKLSLMLDAAEGLNYLHGLNPPILHRDFKTSNLLITANDRLKICDFGFARIKLDNRSMTQRGTPAYTAPEIMRAAKYNEKADIYSFAIVMWEVLTLERPYHQWKFMDVAKAVLQGSRPEPIPSTADSEYKAMMKRAWRDDPDTRPSAAGLAVFFRQRLSEPSAASAKSAPATIELPSSKGKSAAASSGSHKSSKKEKETAPKKGKGKKVVEVELPSSSPDSTSSLTPESTSAPTSSSEDN